MSLKRVHARPSGRNARRRRAMDPLWRHLGQRPGWSIKVPHIASLMRLLAGRRSGTLQPTISSLALRRNYFIEWMRRSPA